jgi:ABC-type branched-subunit amino acid transport system ATPase component
MTGDVVAGRPATRDVEKGEEPAQLIVEDLEGGYGGSRILHSFSMRVERGSIVTVIGPNGAGKSTLLKSIYGLMAPYGGRVVFRDGGDPHDITGWKPNRITSLGLNYVPQLQSVFPSLTVRENLQMGSYLHWGRFEERFEKVLQLFPLFERRLRQRAAALSGGEARMLALARALMSDPKLLLLDEPSAGVAPRFVDEIFDKLAEIQEAGVSILVVEQNARRSLAISDYAYVLDMGRTRFEGHGRDLLQDERVVELYLGGRGRLRRAVVEETGEEAAEESAPMVGPEPPEHPA